MNAPFPIAHDTAGARVQTGGKPANAKLWRPRQVVITRDARTFAHGLAMAQRCADAGLEVRELSGNAVRMPRDLTERAAYALAKQTLAITAAPASKLRLQPIAPSADWRLDLAQGCPAHCAYCYLAGSLKGPPITRAYANIEELFDAAHAHEGQGTITSRSADRAHEGTTYEASC